MGVDADQDLADQAERGELYKAAGSLVGSMFDGLF
jgi:hypothetical protein